MQTEACLLLRSCDICNGIDGNEWTGPLAHLFLFSVMMWIRVFTIALCFTAWASNTIEWMCPLWILRPILTFALVWNTGETDNISRQSWVTFIFSNSYHTKPGFSRVKNSGETLEKKPHLWTIFKQTCLNEELVSEWM